MKKQHPGLDIEFQKKSFPKNFFYPPSPLDNLVTLLLLLLLLLSLSLSLSLSSLFNPNWGSKAADFVSTTQDSFVAGQVRLWRDMGLDEG